jgi:hypothetical protein
VSTPTLVGTDLVGNNIVFYENLYFVIPKALGPVALDSYANIALRPEGIPAFDTLLRAQTASMPALYNTTQAGHLTPKMSQLMKG